MAENEKDLMNEVPDFSEPDLNEYPEEEEDFGADRLELEDPADAEAREAREREAREHEDEPEEKEEPQEKPDYADEILHIVKSNASPKLMRAQLEDYHGKDIAEILPKLSQAERKKVYRILDNDMLSDILEYLEEEDAGKVPFGDGTPARRRPSSPRLSRTARSISSGRFRGSGGRC